MGSQEMTDAVDVKQLEDAIMNYLQHRPPDWKWAFGAKMLGRDETIKRFKADKKFRVLILKTGLLKAVNDFKV